MKFLILIPFYLWKNTFRRWWESPVSPFNKVLITAILSLLAVLVLVFFNEAKNQLLSRLAETDAYAAYVQENVRASAAAQAAVLSLEEESMWLDSFGSDQVIYLRQAHGVLPWKAGRALPILVYHRSLPDLAEQKNEHPIIWLLSSHPNQLGRTEKLSFEGGIFEARVKKMPENLQKRLQLDYAVVFPIEMAQSILSKGFSTHIFASFDSTEEVEDFVLTTDAYYSAQGRQVKSFSSLELLQDIKKMTLLQSYIRIGIVVGSGIILASIIGSIAWLEYRQESYLFALLTSFGTPTWILLIHAYFENMTLVALGLISVYFTWKPICFALTRQMKGVEFSTVSEINLASSDVMITVGAAFISVILAILPVGISLRKQPGLILQ